MSNPTNAAYLECDCGIFIPAPLNPNENNRVTCGGCGIVWRGVDGPADSSGNILAPGSWEKDEDDTYDCDGCGKPYPMEEVHLVNSSQGQTTQCGRCLGW